MPDSICPVEIPDIPSVVEKYRDPKGRPVFESMIFEAKKLVKEAIEKYEASPSIDRWFDVYAAMYGLDSIGWHMEDMSQLDDAAKAYIDDWNIVPIFSAISEEDRYSLDPEDNWDDFGYSKEYYNEYVDDLEMELSSASRGLMSDHRDARYKKFGWVSIAEDRTSGPLDKEEKNYFFTFDGVSLSVSDVGFSVLPVSDYLSRDFSKNLAKIGASCLEELSSMSAAELREKAEDAEARYELKSKEIAKEYGAVDGLNLVQTLDKDFEAYLDNNIDFPNTNPAYPFWDRYLEFRDDVREKTFAASGLLIPADTIYYNARVAYSLLQYKYLADRDFGGNYEYVLQRGFSVDVANYQLPGIAEVAKSAIYDLDRDGSYLAETAFTYTRMVNMLEATGFPVSSDFKNRIFATYLVTGQVPNVFGPDVTNAKIEEIDAIKSSIESSVNLLGIDGVAFMPRGYKYNVNKDAYVAIIERDIWRQADDAYFKKFVDEAKENEKLPSPTKTLLEIKEAEETRRAQEEYDMGW